jgi:hypothetical protein
VIEARNPYIMLGIPFGSSREAALAAFARKSRPLRRQGRQGNQAMTDLTWALNQVSELIREPDVNMSLFRIPADPDAFSYDGSGVLRPRPESLQRRYRDADGALEALRQRASQEYLRYLTLLLAQQAIPITP